MRIHYLQVNNHKYSDRMVIWSKLNGFCSRLSVNPGLSKEDSLLGSTSMFSAFSRKTTQLRCNQLQTDSNSNAFLKKKGCGKYNTWTAFLYLQSNAHLTRKHMFINLLKSTGHVIHQQLNIQQLYVLPTLYLCVLYLSENKQRLVPLTP